MGYKELIASLRKEGEEKVRAIRDSAQAEADRITADAAEKMLQLKEEFSVKERQLIASQEDLVLSAAVTKARTIKLESENALLERLFSLALECLPELRTEKYEAVFASLAKELPETGWDEIVVNPSDEEAARRYFPDSDIRSNHSITGGIEAFRNERKQHIINTFEKRLERSWGEIMPLIVNDVYKEISEYGTPSEN